VPPGGRPAKGRTGGPVDAAEDYRRKTEREISVISRRMKAAGHPAPTGDPTTGVVLLVEQPVGPRVLDALAASLAAVGLPDAYVTYASTGLLKEELLATEPHALVAVGPGAAREVDGLDHPLARTPFSEAEEGLPFAWTRGTSGLLLPSLAPALTDDTRKRRFWRCFLVLKDLAA
jgi:hypothetical protein